MKFSEFFWDFDGTLFDTYPRITRAMQKSLRDMGLERSAEELMPLLKVNLHYASEQLVPGQGKELMARYHLHAEEEGEETIQPYEGVRRLLQSICERGGRNYLYTLRSLTSVQALERCGLTPYFTDYVTKENGFPYKPAPDALLYLMKKHDLPPAQCIMLGDRDIDLLSGLNAGMSCALFDPDHFYDSFETPYRYTTMRELMEDLVWEHQADDLSVADMLALQRDMHQRLAAQWGDLTPERAIPQLLWLVGELGEVVDLVKKVPTDRLTQSGEQRRRLIEELSDVSMYFHDVLQCYHISAQEFSQAYYEKARRNLTRDWEAEHRERYGK